MTPTTMSGRVIRAGRATGIALVSPDPIGLLGGIDPDTGFVVERGHPLQGQSVAGRVLVFPSAKGSTVGSYTLYRLARCGKAPVAILNRTTEAIVAVGAIIADIPTVDHLDIGHIRTGDSVTVVGDTITVEHITGGDG
jgi:uncharacterized protein